MRTAGGPTTLEELGSYIRADYGASKATPLNPAVRVVATFRVSQYLWRRGWKALAKLIEWRQVRTVGSQLAPSAEVGPGLLLPHPVGIVLGGWSRLGSGVMLGQNVTLGASMRLEGNRDQPTLEDGVRVFAGAVIAGAVTIGCDATIGANMVVTSDVAAGAVVR